HPRVPAGGAEDGGPVPADPAGGRLPRPPAWGEVTSTCTCAPPGEFRCYSTNLIGPGVPNASLRRPSDHGKPQFVTGATRPERDGHPKAILWGRRTGHH